MSRVRKAALLVTAALSLLLPTRDARAQFGGSMPGPPTPQKATTKKKDPAQPETHAASGSGDDTIPKPTSGEPQLPSEPLLVPEPVAKRIGSTATGAGVDAAEPPGDARTLKLYPPYFEEARPGYRFRTVFPLWLERQRANDKASLFAGVYYKRRAPGNAADVLFPFVWNLREGRDETTILGPVGWHRSPTSSDTFVAPLVFQGSRPDGGYVTVPPLLTFLKTDRRGGRSIVGPGFCFWTGGQTCNPTTADSIDFGIAPFLFAGKNERRSYELSPPLLHYYSYSELDQSWLNVWGPVIAAHYPDVDAFHIAPLFFRVWGKNEEHITIPPLLFHYGYKGAANLLVTPAFVLANGEKGEKTFVTWGYARHRGRTELDMITPFYWRYEDPDSGLKRKLLFPFVYSVESPRESSLAVFPLFGHFKRFGLSETTWITPFFQHTNSITGWETNLHPLVYLQRDREHSHTVIAPFFWDFATPTSRTTIGFPFYWRFADEQGVSQVALNTYYHEKKLRNGLDWEFHLFPLASYGETPNGHWWNLLYGLAGYTRRGAETKMRLFWVPIQLSQDAL